MFLNISLCEEKSKGNLRGTNDNSMNSYDFHPSLRLCPSYSYQHNIIMGYSYFLWCNLHKIVSTVRRCFMAFKTQCSLYSFNVRRFATELDWQAHLHWFLLHYASSTLQQRVALACSLFLFLSASVDKNCFGKKSSVSLICLQIKIIWGSNKFHGTHTRKVMRGAKFMQTDNYILFPNIIHRYHMRQLQWDAKDNNKWFFSNYYKQSSPEAEQ